ncbi:uncharacterized protein FOMMEDRAFT_154375 [Fomitiporia mediterranea MF3/22]|uniref:uncharacterized protein n=1 Tax=Fomitiporia mediterranea (strain MF3/22) TaxID=694068 RepID=UPI0004407D74|nr:uncharacterized protein FOMMEDRAFT_154375 [Fomitiporia mediterranea MF3/22]EJD05169.1 hypothetical protein FOMMEDRAFT_154375 [Fomitiporia mediterranea MF3/22]
MIVRTLFLTFYPVVPRCPGQAHTSLLFRSSVNASTKSMSDNCEAGITSLAFNE